MSLSNKKRSLFTEEVKALLTIEAKLKQFKAWLMLADEILQERGEMSPHRFSGIDVSFPEAISAQSYPNLIFRILPTCISFELAINVSLFNTNYNTNNR